MSRIELMLWAAGGVQLVIAGANVVLPRILHYRENLLRVSPIVREVFIVHAGYIVLVVIAFGVISIAFAPELAGGSALGRFLSAFLALFWFLRLPVQLAYDPSTRRKYRLLDVAFLAALIFLAGTYAIAALEVWR
jgi:hypothetical protein